MLKIRLKSKLIIAFLVMGLAVILTSAINLRATRNVHGNLSEVVQDIIPSLAALGEIKSSSKEVLEMSRTIVARYNTSGKQSESRWRATIARLNAGQQGLEKAERRFGDVAVRHPEEHPGAAELHALVKALVARSREVVNLTEARGGSKALSRTIEVMKTTRKRILEVLELSTAMEFISVKNKELLAEKAVSRTIQLHYFAVGLVLVLIIVLGLVLTDLLIRPILKLRDTALQIGSGDLKAQVDVQSQDELGELAATFNVMAANLNETTVSKSYVDSIIQAMVRALIVTDVNSVITKVNQAALTLLERSEDELLGQTLATVFPEAALALDSNLKNELREKGFVRSIEIQHCSDTGREIPISLSASHLLDHRGKAAGMVLSAQDISARKEAELQLSSLRVRLIHAQQIASIGTMSAALAHRLNQPLTGLRLFLQQSVRELKDVTCPQMVLDNLDESLEEVEKIDKYIKEILHIAREGRTGTTTSVNLVHVIERITGVLKENAQRANVVIMRELSNLPAVVAVDTEIEELFYILIQNAIHAVKDEKGGTLRITGGVIEDAVEIQVSDTCGGIAVEDLSQIFDMFYTTKDPGKGTGMGLSIAKQIVSHHGGAIRAESTVGEGSTFYVTL
ncbi:ATP-binding protein, partial [Oligoflexia bacterium]|nr:ATP-binding protein [Oligoflexia bacterium]